MKRIVLLALCLISINAAFAQKKVGQLSFIPRVGLNLSNLGDMDFYITADSNDKMTSRVRPDFLVGGDLEYQVVRQLGVSIGAFYSRQGCRWTDYTLESTDSETKVVTRDSYEDQAYILQYINVPVTANLYVGDYFSFSLGVQCGALVGNNWHLVNIVSTETPDGDVTAKSTEQNTKLENMKSLVWSIPVGASFEYERVIIGVRYNIPLTRFNNLISKGGNRVWTFSVGYRI